MLVDYGSRSRVFVAIDTRVRERLLALVQGEDDYVCVPVQGSGTFGLEAGLQTFIPADASVLVLVNGIYGRRIAQILRLLGRRHSIIETREDIPIDPEVVETALQDRPDLTHVATVYCETTSGILNPIPEIASVAAAHGRRLFLDAMSALGAFPINAKDLDFDTLVASANKCLEGVPGLSFVIVRRETLVASEGNATTLSLDLYDQWRTFEKTGQWRFTPPTHVISALDQALNEFDSENGVRGRGERYRRNCRKLVNGMRDMGFRPLLPDHLQAPIVVTFYMPTDPKFEFQQFSEMMFQRGFVLYRGALSFTECFRMACIGRLDENDIGAALDAVRDSLAEMSIVTPLAA